MMNKTFGLITIATAGLLLMFANFSGAETVNSFADLNNNPKSLSFLRSRPIIETAYRFGIEQDKKYGLVPGCKSDYKVTPLHLFVYSPIEFPDDKQYPTKGVWKYGYHIERCGETKLYTIIFVASDQGFPTSSVYYPGWTEADLALVKDAVPAIRDTVSFQSGLKDSKEVDIFDMRVTRPPRDAIIQEESTKQGSDVWVSDKILKGVWEETWTFRVGGRMVDVVIAFVPNAERGGTDYVIMHDKTQQHLK
jgi:hypothetical protein